MIVGLDVSWMNVENRSGGVFQYALRLISAMVERTNVTVVAIIGPAGLGIFESLKEHSNFHLVLLDSSRTLNDIVHSEKIDVVHTPMQFHTNYTLSVPMISTLHDLQPFHYPEFFTAEEIQFRNSYYRKSAKLSERVIVSFEHVKDDIVKFYNIPSEKIDVCPIGMPFQKQVNSNRLEEVKAKYNVPEQYLFYSANTWRHKNHVGLLRALRILHDQYDMRISLVCSGYTYDDYYPEIQAFIHELNLDDFVIFTGYIPEEDMLLLLINATLAVIPTLYEAGSFPLMEAMIYGVPVICSNVTSLPSTIGDSRFIFDPSNYEQMANKITEMINNKSLVEENRNNSGERVRERTWDKAVSSFIEAYSKAIEQFEQKRKLPLFNDLLLNYQFFMTENMTQLRKQLNESEADREARLRLIHELERKHQESERKLQESERKFQESEADRAARLKVIHRLEVLLKESETDRAARLDVIHRLQADQVEKASMISILQQEIYYLQTFDGAFRIVVKKVLKKTGLFEFMKRRKDFLQRLYAFIRKPKVASSPTVSDAINIRQSVQINSPLVEAFAAARALKGNMEERFLVDFYEFGTELRNVLSINPDENAFQALAMMSGAGVKITCLEGEPNAKDLQAYGFTVYPYDLDELLKTAGDAALLNYECIMLGSQAGEDSLIVLQGKLRPNARILSNSQTIRGKMGKQPDRTIAGYDIYSA